MSDENIITPLPVDIHVYMFGGKLGVTMADEYRGEHLHTFAYDVINRKVVNEPITSSEPIVRTWIAEFLKDNPIPDEMCNSIFFKLLDGADPKHGNNFIFYEYLHGIASCMPHSAWFGPQVQIRHLINSAQFAAYIPTKLLIDKKKPFFQMQKEWVKAVDKQHGEYTVRCMVQASIRSENIVAWFDEIYDYLELVKSEGSL